MLFRDGGDDRLGFVFDNWVLTFADGDFSGPYSPGVTRSAVRLQIKELLNAPQTRLSVRCVDGRPDQFLGFIAWQPADLHYHAREERVKGVRRKYWDRCPHPMLLWMQVKEPLRRQGIATSLLKHAGFDPFRSFCYAFRPSEPARSILIETWTGGSWKPQTFKDPPPDPHHFDERQERR